MTEKILYLKILNSSELENLIKVDEATITITVTNEDDEEFWYQMDVFGLESECSGEIPEYSEDMEAAEILQWVVKQEFDILKMFNEIRGIEDFAFRIIINGEEQWVNLKDFNEYVEAVGEE